MNVYYDPAPAPAEKAKYKLNYYKLNPKTGKYELVNSTDEKTGDVGVTYKVTDVDPVYVNRYVADGYTVNAAKDDAYSVTLNEANKVYEMNVYYDPVKPQYTVQYYVEQPDGSYKLYTETTGLTGETGQSVKAEIITIDGYSHIQTTQSKESGIVAADSSTVLKVYYKLNDTPIIQPPVTTESPTTTEEEEEEEEEEEDEDDEDEDEPESKSTKSAKTGDKTDLGFLFIIMLSAVTGSAVCLYIRKKEEE